MQRTYQIYTCGKMGGTSYAEQMEWRRRIDHEIIIRRNHASVKFVHPPLYYNYERKLHHSEREIMEFSLAKVRQSDIVVVNLDGINSSVGSCYEIATAISVNNFGDKHIFIIGIGDDSNVHPWIKDSLSRCEKDIISAAEYIAAYLIV